MPGRIIEWYSTVLYKSPLCSTLCMAAIRQQHMLPCGTRSCKEVHSSQQEWYNVRYVWSHLLTGWRGCTTATATGSSRQRTMLKCLLAMCVAAKQQHGNLSSSQQAGTGETDWLVRTIKRSTHTMFCITRSKPAKSSTVTSLVALKDKQWSWFGSMIKKDGWAFWRSNSIILYCML